jgi:hypothetical protein
MKRQNSRSGLHTPNNIDHRNVVGKYTELGVIDDISQLLHDDRGLQLLWKGTWRASSRNHILRSKNQEIFPCKYMPHLREKGDNASAENGGLCSLRRQKGHNTVNDAGIKSVDQDDNALFVSLIIRRTDGGRWLLRGRGGRLRHGRKQEVEQRGY